MWMAGGGVNASTARPTTSATTCARPGPRPRPPRDDAAPARHRPRAADVKPTHTQDRGAPPIIPSLSFPSIVSGATPHREGPGGLTGARSGAAAIAANAGYLLGTSGGYGGATFDLHLCPLRDQRRHRRAARGDRGMAPTADRGGDALVRAGLVLTLAALTFAGHLGATLTLGEATSPSSPGAAPDAHRRRLRRRRPRRSPARQRAPVYPTLVQPVMQRHCVSCHATGAPRGGLVLDTPDGILKGGDHGPVVTPGRALASELVRRVWLPADHADVMPPRGQRPTPRRTPGCCSGGSTRRVVRAAAGRDGRARPTCSQ